MDVKFRKGFPGKWRVFVNHKGNRTAKPAGEYETALEAKKIIEQKLTLGPSQFPKKEPANPKEALAITVREYYTTFKRVRVDRACRVSTQQRYKDASGGCILLEPGQVAPLAITR